MREERPRAVLYRGLVPDLEGPTRRLLSERPSLSRHQAWEEPRFQGGFAASGLGAAGFGGGLGFSGLIPPSQCGPEYISAPNSPSFHLASKSAAALFAVSPTPTNRFHGYTVGEMEQESPSCRRYNPIGLPR